MLKSPWVLLVWLPLGCVLLVAMAVSNAGGRWPGIATVFAGLGATCFALGLLASSAQGMVLRRLDPSGAGGSGPGAGLAERLPGGPTRRQVLARAAALHAEHPADTPDELAARVRAWYGGGRVSRFVRDDPNGCLTSLLLAPAWLVRDALVAPTRGEFERSVSDAVTAATGRHPPAGRDW